MRSLRNLAHPATLVLLLSLLGCAPIWYVHRSHAPVRPESRPERFGEGIQRTMTLLATSTPEHRNPVRILFYGQSITKQEWSAEVSEYLRTQYPHADLTIENRAIGGYSTEYLSRTLPHDLADFYPDLVIFYDYGPREQLAEILSEIRRNTTAEILVQSYFPTWIPRPGEPMDPLRRKGEAYHDAVSYDLMPRLCRLLGCEVMDVRGPWIDYLKKNGLLATDLLTDGSHLNGRGNALLAEITKRYLRHDPKLPPRQSGAVRTIPVRRGDWRNGTLRVAFEGNRVELVADPREEFEAQAEAQIFMDGKPPSANPALRFVTRASQLPDIDWPAVNRVSSRVPLLLEQWTLRVLDSSPDDSWWRYEVRGSRTGADGEGSTSRRFVSTSGRVVIEPRDISAKRAFGVRPLRTPPGFEVTWNVIPLFTDHYRPARPANPASEAVTVAASGLADTRHVLELKAAGGAIPPLRAIRVYRPAASVPGAN